MSKSWSDIANDNCTCQDRENECCPAHYELLFNTHMAALQVYARNLEVLHQQLTKLEERRKTWIKRVTTNG
jgi:hypothetical protein